MCVCVCPGYRPREPREEEEGFCALAARTLAAAAAAAQATEEHEAQRHLKSFTYYYTHTISRLKWFFYYPFFLFPCTVAWACHAMPMGMLFVHGSPVRSGSGPVRAPPPRSALVVFKASS